VKHTDELRKRNVYNMKLKKEKNKYNGMRNVKSFSLPKIPTRIKRMPKKSSMAEIIA